MVSIFWCHGCRMDKPSKERSKIKVSNFSFCNSCASAEKSKSEKPSGIKAILDSDAELNISKQDPDIKRLNEKRRAADERAALKALDEELYSYDL